MITATCGFCGRVFPVDAHLAGAKSTCPQCGGAATIAPLPMAPKSALPDKLALWTLLTGLVAWLCAILFTPVSLVMGFIALSRAQEDPVYYARARRRAMLGLAIGGLALVAHVVGFLAIGVFGLREEKKALAEGDALYERGDLAGAKVVYEKRPNPSARDQRTKVWLRLGHIYASEGRRELALDFFTKALRNEPNAAFSCQDPDVQKLFDSARSARR